MYSTGCCWRSIDNSVGLKRLFESEARICIHYVQQVFFLEWHTSLLWGHLPTGCWHYIHTIQRRRVYFLNISTNVTKLVKHSIIYQRIEADTVNKVGLVDRMNISGSDYVIFHKASWWVCIGRLGSVGSEGTDEMYSLSKYPRLCDKHRPIWHRS